MPDEMPVKPLAICLFGPTASGKTALAINLAQEFDCEIINADSRQIYHELPILNAMPTKGEMSAVPHHLFGIINLTQRYSIGQYMADARAAAQTIVARGKTPMFVGGTGFYLDGIINGISPIPATDEKVEHQLEERVMRDGIQALHEELTALDPKTAKRLEPADTQRIIRALAVTKATGKAFSDWQMAPKTGALDFNFIKLGLAPSREFVLPRIEARFDKMLEEGLLEEVKSTIKNYENVDDLAGKTLHGLRELTAFFNGEMTLDEAKESIIIQTRQYAKRQMTWMRNSYHPDATFNENTTLDAANMLKKLMKV